MLSEKSLQEVPVGQSISVLTVPSDNFPETLDGLPKHFSGRKCPCGNVQIVFMNIITKANYFSMILRQPAKYEIFSKFAQIFPLIIIEENT